MKFETCPFGYSCTPQVSRILQGCKDTLILGKVVNDVASIGKSTKGHTFSKDCELLFDKVQHCFILEN